MTAAAKGRPATVLIEGDPGVGKTSLIDWFTGESGEPEGSRPQRCVYRARRRRDHALQRVDGGAAAVLPRSGAWTRAGADRPVAGPGRADLGARRPGADGRAGPPATDLRGRAATARPHRTAGAAGPSLRGHPLGRSIHTGSAAVPHEGEDRPEAPADLHVPAGRGPASCSSPCSASRISTGAFSASAWRRSPDPNIDEFVSALTGRTVADDRAAALLRAVGAATPTSPNSWSPATIHATRMSRYRSRCGR